MKPASVTISVRTLLLSAMLGAGTAVVVMLGFKLSGLYVNSLVFPVALGICAGAGSVLMRKSAAKPGARKRPS